MPPTSRSSLPAVLLAAALLGATLALALPLAPSAAHAADVTPEQAQDVARRLRDWLGALLGGGVPIPPDLLRATAADEQVRLDIPLPVPLLDLRDGKDKPTDALISMKLRPLDATRWAIEDIHVPARIALTPELASDLATRAPKPDPGAGTPDAVHNGGSGSAPEASELAIVTGSQSARGVYDTSLQTESRLALALKDIRIRGNGLGNIKQRTEASIGLYTGLFRLRPNPAGGIDSIADLSMDDYHSVSTDPLIGEMRVDGKKVRLRGEISGLMTTQVTQLIQTAIEWGMEAALTPPPATPDDKLGQAGRAKLKAVLAALRNIIAGFSMRENIDGLSVRAMGQEGELDHFKLGLDGSAPDGKLAAHMEIGLEGLDIPALPASYVPFVPRKVSLRPAIGNIDIAAISALAEAAAAPKADLDAIRDKLKMLLAGNGATFGLDQFQVQLGETELRAHGHFTALRPMILAGDAEITVTGFDALMELAQKLPEAKQAIPLLALVRGLARAENGGLVWRLALTEDQKLTINGIDLSKLGAH